jgi:glutathione synthase/RimK-type ligase-like ATP-grasp enzyme
MPAANHHPTIALATCSLLPHLDGDESLVIPALSALDVLAVPAVWDDASVDWNRYDLVVVRSTWDYAERRDEFLGWTVSLPRVLNSRQVLRWNTDKIYLRELASRGIRIVPTTWIGPGAASGPDGLPPGELVVKPAVSAGARNTSRYRADQERSVRAHIDRLLGDGRTVMVQPYLRSVDDAGETALIYFGGVFSHAVNKGPLLTEPGYSTEGLWEPERITPCQPLVDERELAENVLDALPWPRDELVYARVDVVRDPHGWPVVLELELAEPSLFLACADGAAERFARAIATRITQRRPAE